jgi:hypothetical protein
MSSIDSLQTSVPNDPSLQLAPSGDNAPDFNLICKAFEDCVADNQPYVDQCRVNYQTRYAIWNGQSADGKKHSREGSKTSPTPWDGASDLRVFLVDNIINKKVAMECMAFQRANLSAVPVGTNDMERSNLVTNFMRWLIQTQIPEVHREVEIAANYMNEKGLAVMGQFWEKRREKVLVNVRLEDLQLQFPQIDIVALIEDKAAEARISANAFMAGEQ